LDRPINTTASILCTCEGKISTLIDLEALAAFLSGKKVQVVMADKLCEDWTPLEDLAKQSKSAGLVIAACRSEIFLSDLHERLNKAGVDAFSSETLDLPGQSSLGLDKNTNTRLAALLLEGLLEKVRRYPGAAPENLKPFWFRSGEKVSRRQLFSIPRTRYALVPSLDKNRCMVGKGCYLCFAACPTKALVKENEIAVIDKELCTACGACVAPCPSGCIAYPGYTLPELESQLEALLSTTADSSPPPEENKSIAFVCSPSQPVFREFLQRNMALAPDVLPVHVPCLALASPYLILKALSLGASSVLLFSCRSGCQKGLAPEKIESNAHAAQTLAESLGATMSIVHHITHGDFNAPASGIGSGIRGFGKAKLSASVPMYRGESDGKLGTILAALGAELGKHGTYAPDGFKAPLGKVKIDPEVCSFCELCTIHCPTAALRLQESEGAGRIVFDHRDCVACNLCIKMCPERKREAIKVERVLDWDSLAAKSPESLVESKQVCCSKCGTPIGTSLMIDKIRKRLGPGATTAFDLCSHCRFQTALFRNDD